MGNNEIKKKNLNIYSCLRLRKETFGKYFLRITVWTPRYFMFYVRLSNILKICI